MGGPLMERRRQQALKEIADAAWELFVRDGYEATTVEDIAAHAGCSPRTVYRYFGSKEELTFHGLAEVIAGFGRVLDARLAAGMDEWEAVTESLVDFIARFDAGEERRIAERTRLWQRETALRTRYLQYAAQAEETLLDALCRHRGTDPGDDDQAQLIAVSCIGAYRVAVATHGRDSASGGITGHLRASLDLLAGGLAGGGIADDREAARG